MAVCLALLSCNADRTYAIFEKKYYVICDSRSHGSDPQVSDCLRTYGEAFRFANDHKQKNRGHNATVMSGSCKSTK